jgi:hypothetical protein
MFKQKSSDDDLKAMCQKFRQAYSQWDESIRTTDMSSYDEAPGGGNGLRELRLTWMQCLVRIQEIQPRTVVGAKAKLEVASIWSEWSDPAGCFLSEASHEFEALSSERQPRSALSYWIADIKWRAHDWLARAPRSPWRGFTTRADAPIGARRSQT